MKLFYILQTFTFHHIEKNQVVDIDEIPQRCDYHKPVKHVFILWFSGNWFFHN